MNEPEAWLFYCWKPGKSCVFASVDKDDTGWWDHGQWPDQWKIVTRAPLGIIGSRDALRGNLSDLPEPIRTTPNSNVGHDGT